MLFRLFRPLSLLRLCAACLGIAMAGGAAAEVLMPRTPDPLVGDGGVSGFYVWTRPLPPQPGILLRQEPLGPEQMLDNAARGVRVLYSSTDGMDDKTRIAVSGAIYFPKGEKPAGGWPIIAWAHGTTGVADVCAPSWRARSPRDAAYLNQWLAQGYAVVASDYQGLGTPGPHPYLLYKPEGYSVLDNVRAALRGFPGEFANRVVAVGQSQGAGGALGTSYLATTYAPDVKLLGTVATGIVARVKPEGADQIEAPNNYDTAGPMSAAFEMLYLAGTGRVLDPGMVLQDFVSERGQPLLHAALTSCFHDMIPVAAKGGMTGTNIFNHSTAAIDATEMNFAVFPDPHFVKPVFTGTGLADFEAGTTAQYNFISAMCHAGSRVEWHYYPGYSHTGAVNGSLVDSIPFVKKLFAGEHIAGNCAALRRPGPLQKPAPGIPFN